MTINSRLRWVTASPTRTIREHAYHAREREVYELLGQGLTNLQIADLLFISEATVKVHVHHIYDKLGVRSRTALAVQAALERADQATSAIETTRRGRFVGALRELQEVMSLSESIFLIGSGENCLECRDDGRIELAVDRLSES